MVQFPRWQVIFVLVVLVLGAVYAAPNLFSRSFTDSLPDWMPHNQINLGLDLQGGSYLLIAVDLAGVKKDQLEDLEDGVRQAFKQNSIGYRQLGLYGSGVGFTLLDPGQLDLARRVVRELAPEAELDIDDDTQFRIAFSDQAERDRTTSIINQTIEIIRRRVDETGTREPAIQRHGDDRILVQLPGVDNPDRIKELLTSTAALSFNFVDETASTTGRVPAGSELLPAADGTGQSYVVKKRDIIKGESLTDAQPTFQDGQSVVSFTFDTIGGKRFGDATTNNVGRLFAIVLDGQVISAPVIREPILGGSGVISGNFTVQSAQDLALLLRAGALPADLEYLEERSVGPGLGADSIRAGKIAAILGLVFVIAFMGVSYGLFGAMADVALAANLILITAVLSGLQATLTLPGIAGIVLTIGMAVDANVLIFERIREEIKINKRGPVTAIDAGYRRAMTTIIDSNVTTLIAAVLLFQFGTGPIKGFAVTLAIGLVTSMFSAIMLTRLFIVTWLRRRRPQTLSL
ncbi:MAG: protein translocase subunit SecD [Pseudomonadota bacterium]